MPAWHARAQQQQLLLVVAVLAAAAGGAMALSHDKKWAAQPAFCKGLDCPKFSVLRSLGDGIELRRYEPSSWASVTTTAIDRAAATRSGFQALFAYISGANERQAKIAMTTPVLTRIVPGAGPNCESTFTTSFFNGQGDAALAPTGGAGVFIQQLPAMDAWVLSYGGFSTSGEEQKRAAQLMAKLDAAKEPYSTAQWFTAGYDSPWTLSDRHNEVWIPVVAAAPSSKAPAATAAAAAAVGAAPAGPAAGGKPADKKAAAAAAGRRLL